MVHAAQVFILSVGGPRHISCPSRARDARFQRPSQFKMIARALVVSSFVKVAL